MKLIHAILSLFWICCAISSMANSHSEPLPAVGKPFPDAVFTGVKSYQSNRFKVSDQSGKWLFIEFWSLGCTSCFSSFKTIGEIRDNVGNKAEFLLVGKKDNDFNINIESIYKRVSSNANLNIPFCFDSLRIKSWNIAAFPHIYIIDPKGILRFITDGRDLTLEKVNALIESRPVTFYPLNFFTKEFNIEQFAADTTIRYAMILSKSGSEIQRVDIDPANFDRLPATIRQKGWRVANIPLYALYNFAYFGVWNWLRSDTDRYGTISPYPILELKDSSQFQFDYSVAPTIGTFNCFVKMSAEKTSSKELMRQLQIGLNSTFPYQASLSSRLMPVWELRASPGAAEKIRSKGGKSYVTPGSVAGGFELRNIAIEEFLSLLTAHILDDRAIFVNATDIHDQVDFSIEADMTDISLIQNALKKYNLTLVRAVRPMKVLVISDKR